MRSTYHRCHLLIVDDDEDDRYIIHHSFHDLHWDSFITLLDSGDSMIRYLDALSGNDLPLLILLDYNMPKMSGEEILTRLKRSAKYQKIPVAVYSTEMTEDLCYKLKHMGATSCYKKAMNGEQCRKLAETLKQQTQATLVNYQS
jgi:CheY-like chemotaxis protein